MPANVFGLMHMHHHKYISEVGMNSPEQIHGPRANSKKNGMTVVHLGALRQQNGVVPDCSEYPAGSV